MSAASRAFPTALLLAALFGACSEQVAQSDFVPECKPTQFRACHTDACVGYQECVPPGAWANCNCSILDASYVDAADGGDSATD
jgi:hypothetical protein